MNDSISGNEATRSGSPFFWVEAELVERSAAQRYAKVRLVGERLPEKIGAGQFVLVRTGEDPCLPRAFSVLGAADGEIELFVKCEGRVREKFAASPYGTVFEVRGPYGVPYIDKINPRRKYILVGGGSGSAPLLYFKRQHPELVEDTVFGFRTADACDVLTDVPLVVEELGGQRADLQAKALWRPGLGVIACGPEPMLRSLAARHRGQPDVYVSLEARIGCGIGTCLGCSIPTPSGTQRICREGPLFSVDELPWLM